MDTLGNVLMFMTVLIVVLCCGWGVIVTAAAKHRARRIAEEFAPPSEEQLVTGLSELRAAMEAQRQADLARDMHRRPWR